MNTITDFKVDPTFDMNKDDDFVSFDELFGDVNQFDLDILGLVRRFLKIEIFNVKNNKLGAFTVKDAVEQELDEVEGSGLCSNVSVISDVLA